MKYTVIIPARYQSSRLPAKPLADIGGKAMVLRVVDQAKKSDAKQVVVATDHQQIFDCVTEACEGVVMTAHNHESGTDRLAEAAEKLGLKDDDIVVNVQGDEPFMPAGVICQVAHLLDKHPEASCATLCTPIVSDEERDDPNVVKVVFNKAGRALYFSRSAIPFDRDKQNTLEGLYHRHIGLYAYRVGLLKQFTTWPVSYIESFEKLEQLRILDNGHQIAIAVASQVPPAGVDTQADLEAARAIFKEQN